MQNQVVFACRCLGEPVQIFTKYEFASTIKNNINITSHVVTLELYGSIWHYVKIVLFTYYNAVKTYLHYERFVYVVYILGLFI